MIQVISLAPLFSLPLLLALLEIEIEGKHGWADRLPTFRLRLQLLGRPITGYFLYMMTFVVITLHWSILDNSRPWTWQYQLWLLSHLAWLSINWDVLWFILNPFFTLRRFNPGSVWWLNWVWHKNLKITWPFDYELGLITSFVLAYVSHNLTSWLALASSHLLLTLIISMIAPGYHKLKKSLTHNHSKAKL